MFNKVRYYKKETENIGTDLAWRIYTDTLRESQYQALIGQCCEKPQPQSTHRVAVITFWCTFHHDGKIFVHNAADNYTVEKG